MNRFMQLCFLSAAFVSFANTAYATEKNHFWNNASFSYIERDNQQTYILRGNYELGYRTYAIAAVGYGKIDTQSNEYYTFEFDPLKSVRVGIGHYYELTTDIFAFAELLYYRDELSYTRTRTPPPDICLGDGCSGVKVNLDSSAIFATLGALWQITPKFDVGLEYLRINDHDGDDANRLTPSVRYRITDDIALRYRHNLDNGSSSSSNELQLLWTF